MSDWTTKKDWVLLADGTKCRLTEVDPTCIRIENIAHALSNLCRFTGNSVRFYSVAEHSLNCSIHLEEHGPRAALQGLLHDASESILTDVSRPLKLLPDMAGYRRLEALWQPAIYRKFGVMPTHIEAERVKVVDNRMLATERLALLPKCPEWDVWLKDIEPYPGGLPKNAPQFMAQKFMTQFMYLTNKMKDEGRML